MRQTYSASTLHSARPVTIRGARREGDPRYTAYLFSGRQLDLPLSWQATTSSLTSSEAGARRRQGRDEISS